MPHLEKLQAKYREAGLTVIGFNTADDYKIAADLLAEKSATFTNIINFSGSATAFHRQFETAGSSAVPLHYLLDREGRVADAWYGFEGKDDQSLEKRLKAMGLK